jgi:hypothetical protein
MHFQTELQENMLKLSTSDNNQIWEIVQIPPPSSSSFSPTHLWLSLAPLRKICNEWANGLQKSF